MYLLFILLSIVLCLIFFFSSRRRHTRCALVTGVQTCALPIYLYGNAPAGIMDAPHVVLPDTKVFSKRATRLRELVMQVPALDEFLEIGRASCRDRVCQYV